MTTSTSSAVLGRPFRPVTSARLPVTGCRAASDRQPGLRAHPRPQPRLLITPGRSASRRVLDFFPCDGRRPAPQPVHLRKASGDRLTVSRAEGRWTSDSRNKPHLPTTPAAMPPETSIQADKWWRAPPFPALGLRASSIPASLPRQGFLPTRCACGPPP